MKKAIATTPGEPTLYVDLTPEEITVRQTEELEEANRQPAFRDRLRAEFAQVIATHKADLTDLQLAEVIERSAAIDKSFDSYVPLLGQADHKKAIIGLVKRISNLPADKDPVKQAMIDFINTNYV
jgi:hypothetical protein